MKTGLVLEGGAMRGMYTAGVLDVFLEENIQVDGLVGVSAGAVFGCNYKSKQHGRSIRYNKKYCNDSRYVSIRSLITSGDIYNVKFDYDELPNRLDLFDHDTFKENPMAFYTVCTDVKTGEPIYHLCGNDKEEDLLWMRASASMPIVSRPVKIGDSKYLDGGISDSIPIKWFQKMGYDRILVVLTRPYGYRKQPSSKLMNILVKKYPAIEERMKNRAQNYNQTLDYIEKVSDDKTIMTLYPSKDLHIHRLEKDPNQLEAQYQLGRNDTLALLPQIKNLFDERYNP